jgi:hypothetical protein
MNDPEIITASMINQVIMNISSPNLQMYQKRDIEVTSKRIGIGTDMMNDDICLEGNPPDTGTVIQTRSLKTARHPLATVAEDHITRLTRNAPNMDNQNQWRRCMPLKSDQ